MLGQARLRVEAVHFVVEADVTFPEVRLRLPCDPMSARRGRTVVRREVAGWDTGMDSAQLNTLRLLTSELISSCVAHACGDYHELTAALDPLGVRVSVTDGENDRSALVDEHPSVLGDRGLVLIHTYADDWGLDDSPAGKATWFRMATARTRTRQATDPERSQRTSPHPQPMG